MQRNEGSSLDHLLQLSAGPHRDPAVPGTGTMAAAGHPPAEGGDDDLSRLLASLPDFNANRDLQKKLLAKQDRRKAAAEARAAAQQLVRREEEETAEEAAAAEQHAAGLAQLREQLTAGVDLGELREHDAVLEPLPPPQSPECQPDGPHLEALRGAAAALGLDLAAQAAAYGQDESQLLQDLFSSGLRSGFLRSQALQRGTAGAPLVAALLSTLAGHPDPPTAGAAFLTLAALLGDAAASSSCGGDVALAAAGAACAAGWAAPSSGGGLMLEPQYGLPALEAAPGPPPCRLEALPSDAQLLQALRDNGYRPSGGGGGRQRARQGAGGGGAAAAPEEHQEQEQEGLAVRLQALKLVLRTVAAVCRYCLKHPGDPAAAAALTPAGLADLLLAALHIGLDAAANQLQQDLDAAVLALLGAFGEDDWQRRLPPLAERLVALGPSNAARLKARRGRCRPPASPPFYLSPAVSPQAGWLLRKIKTGHPRGWALQQHAAALLLERLLPAARGGAARSAVDRRGAGVDAAAVVAAQRWFGDAKGLVAGATSAGKQLPRGGYYIGTVEQLLKICHLLLWPHMLKRAAGQPSCVAQPFLDGWLAFLVSCQKQIKSMQPEDQAVKVLATYLELEYRNAAEGCLPMSP